MQHPDEGTIHGWLDGALSERDAAAVAMHVDTCAECAERVREARGLIAGASRIVVATDWGVGAGTGMREGPARGIAAPSRTRPRRVYFTAWRSAAAAVLVVAAGTLVVTREAGRSTVSENRAARMIATAERVGGASAPAPVARSAEVPPGAATGTVREPRVAPAKPQLPRDDAAARPTAPSVAAASRRAAAPAGAPAFAASAAPITRRDVAPFARSMEAPDTQPRPTSADMARAEAVSADMATRSAARAGAARVGFAAGANAGVVRPALGASEATRCYEIRGDSVPAYVPRRFVLAGDGSVQVDGSALPRGTWRESPSDAVDVVLGGEAGGVLHVVQPNGNAIAVLRDARGERIVRIRRCQ